MRRTVALVMTLVLLLGTLWSCNNPEKTVEPENETTVSTQFDEDKAKIEEAVYYLITGEGAINNKTVEVMVLNIDPCELTRLENRRSYRVTVIGGELRYRVYSPDGNLDPFYFTTPSEYVFQFDNANNEMFIGVYKWNSTYYYILDCTQRPDIIKQKLDEEFYTQ